jgi:hypothetical protein
MTKSFTTRSPAVFYKSVVMITIFPRGSCHPAAFFAGGNANELDGGGGGASAGRSVIYFLLLPRELAFPPRVVGATREFHLPAIRNYTKLGTS